MGEILFRSFRFDISIVQCPWIYFFSPDTAHINVFLRSGLMWPDRFKLSKLLLTIFYNYYIHGLGFGLVGLGCVCSLLWNIMSLGVVEECTGEVTSSDQLLFAQSKSTRAPCKHRLTSESSLSSSSSSSSSTFSDAESHPFPPVRRRRRENSENNNYNLINMVT